jgi:uncharacterized membrane protein
LTRGVAVGVAFGAIRYDLRMTLRSAGWWLMLVLAVLVTAYALAGAAVPALRTPFVVAMFELKPLRSLFHLAAGGIALATGALQFSARLRARHARLHRTLGKVYVVAATLSGISSLLLAPVSSGGLAAHFGFGMLGALWLVTTWTAYLHARNGRFAAHRTWMIRSYALCLAAVTLRIYLPASVIAAIPFSEAYPAISWLCWVPNIIIAEWFVVRSKLAPVKVQE